MTDTLLFDANFTYEEIKVCQICWTNLVTCLSFPTDLLSYL